MKFGFVFPTCGVVLPLLPALTGSCTAFAQQIGSYAGGSYVESFDLMGGGTAPPTNWCVGVGGTAALTVVTVSDGSAAPVAGIGAYNFGLSFADPDRALGTIPIAGSRLLELRLRNDTGRSLTAFTLRYDGEQWRIGSQVTPTALVLSFSTDGVNYTALGPSFDFVSPRVAVPPLTQNVAVNGNESANRVAGLGGTYTLTTPIAAGAVLYLRWLDADEAGADPGLAIDNVVFEGHPSVSVGASAGLTQSFRFRLRNPPGTP